MVKALILYPKPDDRAAFERHYYDIHLPLVRKIPHLKSLSVNRDPPTTLVGKSPYHLVVELEFASQQDCDAAFASAESRLAAEDLATFAPPGRVRFVYEVRSVMPETA
ncbi:MAG TPA: EthD family reductase [Agrobacterium sp.]|uniref:EthD family reductase n=1 Tax=Rhizobium sp. TaxID=391 RepID=UPI000E9193BE|nr:EthD family reductase [Agrobacterium sp.]